MKRLLLHSLLLVGYFSIAQNATGQVRGTVISASTLEPIYQASVELKKDEVSVYAIMTDFDGKFSFAPVEPGMYDVMVKSFGQRDYQITNFKVSGDSISGLLIEMPDASVELSCVNVVGSVPLIEEGRTMAVRSSRSNDQIAILDGVVVAGSVNIPQSAYDLEHREKYNENPVWGFSSPISSPLSTFGMDVDNASYQNITRMIEHSLDIPRDAVRTEEFINSFSYSYEEPDEDQKFNITSELSTSPWNTETQILRIGLSTQQIPLSDLPPSNLVFLVDVSGSMQGENRLGLVQKGLELLTEQLRGDDRISLVTYAGRSSLVLSSAPGTDKQRIKDAIRSLSAGGSTNGSGGIHEAYKQAQSNFIENGSNRVILCTDGDFNVGISSQSELIEMIEEKRETGVFLSVVGVGQGNYQEGTMEQLANKGNGNFNYVSSLYQVRKLFVESFGSLLFTAAKDAKVQVELNPLNVQSYRLLGYENRAMADEDFADDTKDGGEVGMGHQVTMIYEIVPGSAFDDKLLRYQDSESGEFEDEIATISIRYKEPHGETSSLLVHHISSRVQAPSIDQKFSSAVAAFAGVLRQDPHIEMSIEEIIILAKEGKGSDENESRSDFVQLAQLFGDFTASSEN